MDESLPRLLGLLAPDITESQLVAALYAIRAPRRLVGIIPAMRQFRDWRRRYPALALAPEGMPDYCAALQTLDRIADLDSTDQTLSGRVIAAYKSPWTPLRPHTGDSVIGELLLVRAADGVNADAFEEVSARLLKLAQQFHAKSVTVEAYDKYLRGDIESLKSHRHGSRLYQAYLAFREMADGSEEGNAMLGALVELSREYAHADGFGLAVLASLPGRDPGSHEHTRLRQKAAEILGVDETEVANVVKRVGVGLPGAFALVLRTIHEGALARVMRARRRSGGGTVGRSSIRPCITHGSRLTEVLQSTEEGDLHAGDIAQFFPARNPDFAADEEHGDDLDDVEPEDDDPEERPMHPAFSVFLAKSDDLLLGYFAAKGVQSALEYENVRLPWSKWILSSEAIQAILDLVAGPAADPDEPALDREARLAIGLSLISGRDLDEVVGSGVCDGTVDVDASHGLVIQRAEHVLYARPGKPNLRGPAEKSSPFFLPRANALRLPLPEAWRSLVGSIQTSRPRRNRVAARARVLLGRLRGELGVTSKGLRIALHRELDELTRGDLGVLAVLTDGAEANARNIVHYASYEAAQIERWWRQAAESLIGPLPPLSQEVFATGWVGARDAFDPEALERYFGELRQRLRSAELKGDWPRAFNLMTLYLAYWLGLGLALRRTRNPFPRVLLAGDWVWVGDKRRRDGSTDRLVPITSALRAQIDAYVALASELALFEPGLDPIVVTEHGTELKLRYLRIKPSRRGGYVIPYTPSIQERHKKLARLPANWGRKVARSLSTELPGRFRDAEFGHWVRGRHAWDATSTLDAKAFREAWLELQRALERRLGFDVVTVAGCSGHRRPAIRRSAPYPARLLNSRKAPESKPRTAEEGREALARVDEMQLEQLAAIEPPDRSALALQLVRQLVDANHALPVDEQWASAEGACAYLRKEHRVPIFTVRPRFLRAQPVVLDAAALHTLAYLQQRVLPAFERDLACLPVHAKAPTSKHDLSRVHIELGRLVMIGIWRLGLMRWAVLDGWLRALDADKPILAQGGNRYMCFRVNSSRKGVTMRRTVLLDDFTIAYLCVEGSFIRESLLAKLKAKPAARLRNRMVQASLDAYLRSIGVRGEAMSVAQMMRAAMQYLMLESTPLIAAYAGAQLDTEDLGDSELRRLGGLRPRRGYRGDGDGLMATHFESLEEGEVPEEVIASNTMLQSLVSHRSSDASEWRKHIASMEVGTPAEALLRAFALWLLDEAEVPSSQKLTRRQTKHIVNRVSVVAYALLGHTDHGVERKMLTGETLLRLQELTRDHFPDRTQHGAWFQLHRFLSTAGKDKDLGGLEVQDLGAAAERTVSAKILIPAEQEQIQALALSPRSGIGNAAFRVSARTQTELMATFGMRRAESAHLRAVDYQHDLCRIQAYGEHTLKTAAAARVIPVAFASRELAASMKSARGEGFDKLIDTEPQRPVDPNSFYDPLSRLIKRVTRDESMGSHHLRHTLVSRMVLTLQWEAASVEAMAEDLPWLSGFRIEPERLSALLGSEGNAGQGMRAVSALVGHTHPNTTIRHYTHTLCIALRGVLNHLDRLDMRRSFEHRLGARSTLKRWVQIAEAQVIAEGDVRRRQINRRLRARFEQRLDWPAIDIDETPLTPATEWVIPEVPQEEDGRGISFDYLELVDRSLRDRHALLPQEEIDQIRVGLAKLHEVPSGKRGVSLPRHPLEDLGDGIRVPFALAAGQATAAAFALCVWLQELKRKKEEDFDWLLTKWIYASESERGRMLLKDEAELIRASQMGDGKCVQMEVSIAAIAQRDKGGNAAKTYRMRIRCLDAAGGKITRDVAAVRWVMSYVAALRLAPRPSTTA